MLCLHYWKKLLLLLSLVTFTSCINNNDFLEPYEGLQAQNLSITKQQYLLKAVVPEYLHGFLDTLADTSNLDNRVARDWFVGVNPTCESHVVEWMARLGVANWGNIANEENKWVLHMIDAWGKIPEGILAGHTSSYGDFDECVQIEVTGLKYIGQVLSKSRQFDGLYCSAMIIDYNTAMSMTPVPVEAKLTSNNNTVQEAVSLEEFLDILLGLKPSFLPLLPQLGVCFPNSCTQLDIQQIMVNGLRNLYSNDPEFNPKNHVWPLTYTCTDRHKPDLDAAAISIITLLAVITGLALSAGILDYWQSSYKTDPVSSKSEVMNSRVYKYFMAFSAYTNTKKLLSTRRNPEDLGCLHGIRFLSMAWVVLAHTYARYMASPSWNTIDVNNIYKRWTELTVINGTFAVDTFFVMTGLLTTYNILKTLEKTKGKLNVPMLYIHRYIRLTPTYAILIGISTTLLTYAGNGPMWYAMEGEKDNCKKNWWTNLLYINNLVHTDKMCYGEAWYLANDMQFFILSPFIVYPIWKWERIGTILLVVYTVLSWVAPALVVAVGNKPPFLIATRLDIISKDMTDIYYRPWAHISTFFAGIWVGWLLFKTRGQTLKISKLAVLALWAASTGLALTVIYGIFPWHDPTYDISKLEGTFYAGLSRFTWAVAVSWVMFACIKGYGGIVNKFLSWSAFMPLGRLCFCVYLTSFHLQGIFHARLTVPLKFDTYTIVNIYFAHMVTSCLVGFLCTLLLESPFIILVKLLLEGVGKSGQGQIKSKHMNPAAKDKDGDKLESNNNANAALAAEQTDNKGLTGTTTGTE